MRVISSLTIQTFASTSASLSTAIITCTCRDLTRVCAVQDEDNTPELRNGLNKVRMAVSVGQNCIVLFLNIHHHHHHHHVQEGLGLIPVPCILKMKLVPPSLPGSSYVSSSFWFIL